jgi:hypothetical protein
MLTKETLESDTKMIRGVPIFSASAMLMVMMVMKILECRRELFG